MRPIDGPEVVRLLDAALDAHVLGGEPYPTAPATSEAQAP